AGAATGLGAGAGAGLGTGAGAGFGVGAGTGFAAAGFFAGAFAFTVFLAFFGAAFFALRFFDATFSRLFFRAGAAFFAFFPLAFLAFFVCFAMIDLPIVRLPLGRAPKSLPAPSRPSLRLTYGPTFAVRPHPLASSEPPAPAPRSPNRSARSDEPPEYRCP